MIEADHLLEDEELIDQVFEAQGKRHEYSASKGRANTGPKCPKWCYVSCFSNMSATGVGQGKLRFDLTVVPVKEHTKYEFPVSSKPTFEQRSLCTANERTRRCDTGFT